MPLFKDVPSDFLVAAGERIVQEIEDVFDELFAGLQFGLSHLRKVVDLLVWGPSISEIAIQPLTL